MDGEKIFRFFLNWQVRRKIKKLENELIEYSSIVQDLPKSEIKPISSTFIYTQAPDYQGKQTLNWSEEQWITEFKRLRDLGIDMCIFHASITESVGKKWQIFYPISEEALNGLESARKRIESKPIMQTYVVSRVLDAAQKSNMQIHLGLFFPISGWFRTSTADSVKQIQAEMSIIAKDLLRLYGNHPALAGWYIPSEIMYPVQGAKLHLNMHEYFHGITQVLKRKRPDLPIGISPGSDLPDIDKKPFIKFWRETLTNSGINVLYPMDAMGQLVNFPGRVAKIWPYWKEIVKDTGVTLWANVETFERRSFNNPHHFEAAHFNRILWQLAACSPYVEKVVSWECLYFLDKDGAVGGAKLVEDYKDYFEIE